MPFKCATDPICSNRSTLLYTVKCVLVWFSHFTVYTALYRSKQTQFSPTGTFMPGVQEHHPQVLQQEGEEHQQGRVDRQQGQAPANQLRQGQAPADPEEPKGALLILYQLQLLQVRAVVLSESKNKHLLSLEFQTNLSSLFSPFFSPHTQNSQRHSQN